MSEFEVEHPAARACRTLNNHVALIGNAIVYNNALIQVTEKNEKVIASLYKDELGNYDQEERGFNISKHVIDFVSFYEKKNRRITDNSQQILSMVVIIRDTIADFESAKIKNSEDAILLKEEIADRIVNLANEIFASCFNFSSIALEYVSMFHNKDMLISRLEKSLVILNALTQTLKILDFNTLNELGASDIDLEKIVSQKLTPVVKVCNYDLKNSALKLHTKLNECRQDKLMQKRSNIVDALYRMFQSKQELNTQIDHSTAPDVFYRVEKTELVARANLSDMKEEVVLSELSNKVASKADKPVEKKEAVDLPDVTDGVEVVVAEPTKLEIALDNFFDALTRNESKHPQLSAVQTYAVLDPGCDIDYWLVSVTNYYRNQFKEELHIEFAEEQDPIFTGNSQVTDVIISRIPSPEMVA